MPAEVVKKAQATMAARSRKGAKNTKLQYTLWIGGSIGSIVVACILLVINPDKGPFGVSVNDASLVTHVNRNAKTWQAAASSFFEGWTLGDVKLLEGVGISQRSGSLAACPAAADLEVPDSFDSREKWPQCFTSPVYSMGNCSASWAITAASSLSNRLCISDPEKYGDLQLSPQQLLSCDSMSRGCKGGEIDIPWNYIKNEGLVSETCFPYQGDSSVTCGSRCSTETPIKAGSSCMLSGEAAIKKEIFQNGPVIAPIFLTDDFLVYHGGLFQETATSTPLTGMEARRQRLIQAVKVVGWGSINAKKYWIIENSWGEDWGENGYARIIRGGDPEKRESIIIETFMLAGTPASDKIEEPKEEDDDDSVEINVDQPAASQEVDEDDV